MSERPNTYMWAVICIFLIVMASPAFAGKIIYVDDDAAGANDGSSWTDAYKYLQDALADANSADKPVEIRIARGVYRPDRNTAEPNGTGDRTATFQLINGVTLKGGYAGLGEPDPNTRDVELFETILSGDLNGNDVNIIDPVDSKNEPTRAENSYHVVTGSGTNETVVLEGLTITAGNANGKFDNTVGKGGGIFNDNSRLSLTHCTFKGNSAYYGGGMFIYNSDLTITNCNFSGNSGKGMHSWESNATLTNCTFSGNSDGGMYNWLSKVMLTNCEFKGNSGDIYGGGMENNASSPILNNCTFFGNTSLDYGGGMFNWGSNATLTNCTFTENSASIGGGMYNDDSCPTMTNCTFTGNSVSNYGSGMSNFDSSPILTDCTFIRNTANYDGGGMHNYKGIPTLINCTFTGNWAGLYGGGMRNLESNATLIKCKFKGNSAGVGGGMRNYKSSPNLTDCSFSGNGARSGGGMHNSDSSPILTNCRFAENSAGGGGGIYNYESSPTLTNCTFSGNSAKGGGGGMFNSVSSPTFANCTFAKNSAQDGNALYCSLTSQGNQYTVQLTNCILWDGGDEIFAGNLKLVVSFSDIQGGQAGINNPYEAVIWGEGNIDADPCFADPGYWDPNGTPDVPDDDFWVDGDYHLKSQAGRWTSASSVEPDAHEGRWTKDDVTSPCIDAGDPSSPIGFEPFPNGGIINMGAYGGTAEASKSYFGGPVCETIVAGDINGDCKVDFEDFEIIASHWLESTQPESD